jgi:DNA polymerase-4
VADEATKSVGAEETFERDLVGEAALLPRILGQSETVARRLREAGLRGRTVTLKVKFGDFTLATRRVTLGAATDDGGEIHAAARAQLARLELDRPVRLTGVAVSGFDAAGTRQLGLFDARPDPRRAALHEAVDGLARRFGPGVVRRATLAEDDPDEE